MASQKARRPRARIPYPSARPAGQQALRCQLLAVVGQRLFLKALSPIARLSLSMGNSDDIDGVVFHKVDKREWKYGEDVSLRACKITRPALRSFQNNFDCVIEFPQKCRFSSFATLPVPR